MVHELDRLLPALVTEKHHGAAVDAGAEPEVQPGADPLVRALDTVQHHMAARHLLDDLERRRRLGCPEEELKLPAERGAFLGKVVADSPAAKAGLKENDVVTEINGQRVEGAEQFRRMIREIPAGRTAQFTIWRDGHSETLSVTLGKSDEHQFSFSDRPGTFAFHMPEVGPMPSFSGLGDFAFSFLGRPRLGIYRWHSSDCLIVCCRPAEVGRPTSFDTSDGQELFVFRRVKPGK